MLELLDTAIGLILIVMLLSMLASALQELIAAWLNRRGRRLEQAILQLLSGASPAPVPQDPPSESTPAGSPWTSLLRLIASPFRTTLDPAVREHGLAGAVLTHGRLAGMFQERRLPAYLPGEPFADALIDVLRRRASDPAPTAEGLAWAIAQLPAGTAREALSSLLVAAAGDTAQFRSGVMAWYADTMDRVSGWYAREVRNILLAIGLILAAVLNVDALHLAARISADATLRASLVAAAQTVRPPAELQQGSTPRGEDAAADEAKRLIAEIRALGVPIGWNACNLRACDPRAAPVPGAPPPPLSVLYILFAMPGWLLTGLAVSMGAPFWFDLLQKLLRVRAAGVKPNSSEDRAAVVERAQAAPPAQPGAPAPTGVIPPSPVGEEDVLLSRDDIRLIQARLGLPQTGEFDDVLRAALRDIQRIRGLPADGVLRPSLLRSIVR
jgi:hypothetical protein